MLASPKTGAAIVEATVQPEEVEVSFLRQDGNLSEDSTLQNEHGVLVSTEDHRRFGKVEIRNGRKTYYLKQFRGGRPGEILPDPYGAFAKAEDLSAFTVQRGERFCEYAQVKPLLFDQYRQYLQSRNPIFFKMVERQILCGEGK